MGRVLHSAQIDVAGGDSENHSAFTLELTHYVCIGTLAAHFGHQLPKASFDLI